ILQILCHSIRHSSFLPMPNIPFPVAKPSAGRHLLLRKKLDPFPALHVQVAKKGIVPAVEWKPGHRRRHPDVDADHAAVDAVLELAGRLAVARENRSAISKRRTVGQLD